MRAGLATSLVAHAVLITLGVVGLHGAEELQPMPVEAISVDLVPIEEVASIRQGTERSDIIETPTPAAVDTPDPTPLAERPGATEKDQPKPEESQTPSPAPTVQTAPEPVPVPEEQQPEPAAEVPPAPELAATPTEEAPTDTPAPVPAMRTASIQRQQTEAKPTEKPAEKPKPEKPKDTKPADQVANIINSETSRGTTTGTGGQAAAGKTSGQAQRLTQSELGALIAQMQRCWKPSLQDRNDGIIIKLLVRMNPDGSVDGTPEILTDVTGSTMLGLSARAAARNVASCVYDLPSGKFSGGSGWNEIEATLDASQAN